MKHIGILREKLSNSRGAAMIIALLIFFLAVLSGTAVLTMATSNAGRYTHAKDDQQAYLSVASAAKLILSRLEGITVKYVTDDTNKLSDETDEMEVTFESGKTDLFLADERFIDNLKKFSVTGDEETETVSFTLTVPEAPEMGKVYVESYILGSTFFFRIYSANGDNREYQMTMEVNAEFSPLENFQLIGKKFYRELKFDTANVKYTVERSAAAEAVAE